MRGRQILAEVTRLIYDSQPREDWRRDHLGASIAGHPCDRFLWLAFRWALDPKHDGRMLRLFSTGNQQELRILSDLRRGGADIEPEPREFLLGTTGHIGGKVDGIGAIPGIPGKCVIECKTHSANSFARLVEKGVRSAKPQHFVQVQLYMLGTHINQAVYIAVNKDTDEVHAERIEFDEKFAKAQLERAEMVVRMQTPPPVEPDPTLPPCTYTGRDGKVWPCQFLDLCHGYAKPDRSCRTCLECSVVDGGAKCDLDGERSLTPAEQRAGCSRQVSIPSARSALWSIRDVDEAARTITYQRADGVIETEGGACSA